MYIESIELDNFKSFGEKVLIPLFPGFTTVSGPNGSGKSNIIDSLLFAFGLSTNKIMRAERLTDLMNNLSGKDETKVTVTLYDEKDESQIKVARKIRLKRNGQYESIYYFNDKATTLGYVHDQLALRNVSPNAYNVVMQGDVTRIISMTANERRKIIDELAGVAQFDRKIESARTEIEAALEQLNSQTILLSEFSDRLESLKKERDQAVKYAELRDKRNKLELILRHARIQELEKKIEKSKEQYEKKTIEKEELLAKYQEVNTKTSELEAEFNKIQGQIAVLDKEEKIYLTEQLDEAKEKTSRIAAGIEYQDKQISDYQKEIEVSAKEQEIATQKINEIQEKLNEIRKKKTSLDKDLEKYNNAYAETQEKIRQQSGSLSSNKVFELQQEQNSLQTYLSEINTKKAISTEKLTQIDRKIQDSKKEFELALTQLTTLESNRQSSKSDNLNQKINSLSKYLERLRQEKSSTEQEIKQITTDLYECEKQLSKLELTRQASEEHNFGRAVDAILNSGINGVHGVLAQLGQVSPKYSLALETAAGARLRSIVVEDDSIAQRLIEFLRSNRLGRATFLPLNKFTEIPAYPDLQRARGVVDWAFDLVKTKSLYLPVFAYAFGTTVVVDNLTNARNLLGRYRMVTTDGDLLDKSGAMTGGSQKRTGGPSFGNVEAQRVSELQSQIKHLENNLASSQSSINELTQEVSQTERELEILRNEWTNLRVSENTKEADYIRVKDNVATVEQELKSLSTERESLELTVEQSSRESQDVEKKLQKISNDLITESSRMKESGLEELINYSQEIEYEKKQLEVESHNLEYEKANLLGESDHQLQNIHRRKADSQKAEEQIKELTEKKSQQQSEYVEHKALVESFEAKLSDVQKQLDEYNQSKDQINQELISLTELRTSTQENLKNISFEIKDLAIKINDLQERLTELSNIEDDSEADLIQQIKEELNIVEMVEADLRKELESIEKRMHRMEPINMKAIDEYDEVLEKLNELKEKCESLESERKEIEKRIQSYTDHKTQSFFEAYNSVNKHFTDIFAELSFGHGELILENPEQPFEGGLIIQARPRNKKMQRLESMSGGEKSLTALSFLFALQWHNPAPFYAFDEVDMFLDGLNVERLSKMVQKQSKLAQFIVVSLRKPMLEKSERAIGVCLGRNSFSTVSGIKLRDEIKEESQDEQEEAVTS